MINLAQKDIAHTLGKFLVTAMGVGMLLGIVLIMIGVYRGMITEAKVLLEDIDAMDSTRKYTWTIRRVF